MNNNEELLRQCIASGQVSASQIEAHRQAGDLSDERSSGATTQAQAVIKLEPLAVTYGEIPTDDNWISVHEALGFTIENRAGVDVLVWKDGGCRPATSAEVAIWQVLAAKQQAAPKAAPGERRNTKTHDILSTIIGLFLGHKQAIGYKPGSVIDKVVNEAVEHLKDWPYPEAAPQPEAAPLHKAVAAAAVTQSTALYNSIVEKRKAKAKHPDDAAVDRFAEAMKQKLSAARAKGRGGWDTPECTQQRLSDMLREHVGKGDPRDVANFCMFLWCRGEAIAAAPQPAPAPLSDEREAFESTWEKLYGKKPVLWDTAFKEAKMDVPAHSAGKYFYRDAQAAWKAWQARAALATQKGTK